MLCFRSFKAGKSYSSDYVKTQLSIQAFNSSCVYIYVQSVSGFLCVHESCHGRGTCGCLAGFLECLHVNKVSIQMVCNYLSATKVTFIMYGLPTVALDDKKLHYFITSVKINRPLSITLNVIQSVLMICTLW